MKGRIKAYSSAVNAGFIKGEDNKDYQFTHIEWQGSETPQSDESVIFVAQSGRAKEVKKAGI